MRELNRIIDTNTTAQLNSDTNETWLTLAIKLLAARCLIYAEKI